MAKPKVSAQLNKAILNIAKKMSGNVNVGWLEGAKYADGTPVAEVMFLNEYGHKGRFPAPPRPAFRQMIAKEKPTWGNKVAKLAKATDNNGPQVLALMGEDMEGALKQSIIDLTAPALSPTTLVLRKRFGNQPHNIKFQDVLDAQEAVRNGEQGATGTQAKPLVWTGHALASTGYEVKK